MSIKYLMKKAGMSPADMVLATGAAGGGLGLLYGLNRVRQGRWSLKGALLRAALLGLGTSVPALIYGAARGSLDKDPDGYHTYNFIDRWALDDKAFGENPFVQYNIERKKRFVKEKSHRELDPITKEQVALKKEQKRQKRAWAPIPTNSLNNFNRVNFMSAATGRTPVQDVLFANGLMNNTRQKAPGGLITPGSVVGNLVNAGIGYGTAYVAGKALGAMAGVSPQTQNTLCQMGAWGGMLSGIHNTTKKSLW